MASFFNKFKSASATTGSNQAAQHKKKDDASSEITPLEKMLQNAGALREDGRDKFFGLENFGNTCYCNSIVQALYHSAQFRDNILKYTPFPANLNEYTRFNVQIRAPAENDTVSPTKQKGLSQADALKRRQAANSGGALGSGQKPEDNPDSPEYKKKMALQKGPVLELTQENPNAYGMGECTFTGLKDIFSAMIESNSRTGVLSPARFLDIFKRDNENFRTSMHQDAHEFYGLLLNDLIATIEENAKRLQEQEGNDVVPNGHAVIPSHSSESITSTHPLNVGWVHDIFEGLLTSETKCLACETTSQRDETFLDLSIDLEEHSSVTSCLNSFSAEEMLCERNKFHCDTCGGLQEAEKRMKLKRLPKVLALHLKRFKYTEDYSRLQKLFHRVVYPYYLRMFNTTDDVEEPDRLYELYGVVVHIGGNAYHGHYVSVIKTQDRGWLLFDDEMVEPVDKHFVKNFFGDKPGMACAYLLLYQETTFEKALVDQDAEGYLDIDMDEEGRVSVGEICINGNGVPVLPKLATTPNIPSDDTNNLATAKLEHAMTAPVETYENEHAVESATVPPIADAPIKRSDTTSKSKSEQRKEAKALEKALEKARKLEEKERLKADSEKRKDTLNKFREVRRVEAEDFQKAIQLSLKEANGAATSAPAATDEQRTELFSTTSFLSLKNKGSKSVAKKSFSFLGKEKNKDSKEEGLTNGSATERGAPLDSERSVSSPQFEKLKDRFSFNLGRKKSSPVLG